HHTNIVPVHGVGEQGGVHYYVMQFIPGQGLDQVLAELRRLRRPAGGPAAPDESDGSGSAAGAARSMLSGQFAAPPADDGGPGPPRPAAGVHLPGQSGGSSLSETGRQYWRSAARVGPQ